MHSTGPWTAMVTDTMGDTPALWDIVQRSSGGTVAEIQSHNPDDAALVAAAPDLLAALRSIIESSDANCGDSLANAISAARAAIKAVEEGK